MTLASKLGPIWANFGQHRPPGPNLTNTGPNKGTTRQKLAESAPTLATTRRSLTELAQLRPNSANAGPHFAEIVSGSVESNQIGARARQTAVHRALGFGKNGNGCRGPTLWALRTPTGGARQTERSPQERRPKICADSALQTSDTLRCRIRVPAFVPRKFSECMPMFGQFGPQPIEITRCWPNTDRTWPSWDRNTGRLSRNVGRTSTNLGKFGPNSTNFGASSTNIGLKSTKFDHTRPEIGLTWPEFDRFGLLASATIPGNGQPEFDHTEIGQIWPGPHQVVSTRPGFDRSWRGIGQLWHGLGKTRPTQAWNPPRPRVRPRSRVRPTPAD